MLKHISGQDNKVVDALSRRNIDLQESQIQVLGFHYLKELYKDDIDFQEAFEAFPFPNTRDRSPWSEYMLQEDLMFKNNQLCISKLLTSFWLRPNYCYTT